MLSSHTILGVTFKVGPGPDIVDHVCATGGLVVVPSAPVLVGLAEDASLREAVIGADTAITDSGLMVLLWRLFKGQKLERVSGLEYLKLLLARPENKQPGALFFVMPGEAAKARNLAWLQREGFHVTAADCYVAPFYGAGPLRDEALLWQILARQPRHIILCLGGGVQERIGWFLRNETAPAPGAGGGGAQRPESGAQRPEAGDLKPEGPERAIIAEQKTLELSPTKSKLSVHGSSSLHVSALKSQVSSPVAPRPAIHCIGAAIGFLTGDQVKIPMWVDYLYLGWLWRIASAPTKFFPRYWKATRLVGLMWKYGEEKPTRRGKAET